jgi:uncharacterized phage infection (PIP) family protein YhgE
LTEEEAKNYVNVLGTAAYATSSLTTSLEKYGQVWQSTEKISQSMSRITNLQREYNRALDESSDTVQNAIQSMLNEYSTMASEYEKAFDASTTDLAKVYAQG